MVCRVSLNRPYFSSTSSLWSIFEYIVSYIPVMTVTFETYLTGMYGVIIIRSFDFGQKKL